MKSPAQTPHIGVRAVRSEPHGGVPWRRVAHLGYMDSTQNQTACVVGEMVPLMGIGEVASLIGVPVATMYEWRTRGRGPVAYRFGKHLRFSIADVEEWIESCREGRLSRSGGGEDSSHPHDRRGSAPLCGARDSVNTSLEKENGLSSTRADRNTRHPAVGRISVTRTQSGGAR